MFLLITIALVLVCGGFAHQSDSGRCNINDLNVETCVLKALNSLKPEESNDDNQIKPLVEPFFIPIFHVSQNTPMVNYTGICKNYTIRGMDKFEVKDMSFDRATMTFQGSVEYQPLTISSDYEIEGSLLSIPISGSGSVSSVLGPVNARVTMYGKIVRRGNIRHYNPTHIKIKMIADDVELYFNGLFGLNKDLERITNTALNTNSNILLNALTPAIEDICNKVFFNSIKSMSRKMLYVEDDVSL